MRVLLCCNKNVDTRWSTLSRFFLVSQRVFSLSQYLASWTQILNFDEKTKIIQNLNASYWILMKLWLILWNFVQRLVCSQLVNAVVQCILKAAVEVVPEGIHLVQNQNFGRRKIRILKRKCRFRGFRGRRFQILGCRNEIRKELEKTILILIS